MTNKLNLKDKSVAVVGPAVPLLDQSAEVEACDVIIRCNYRWNGHERLYGYGERTEGAFYNGLASKSVSHDEAVLSELDFVLLKDNAVEVPHAMTVRTARPFDLANQVPIILHWLESFEPAEIHVFGSDFYTSGYEGSTHYEYLPDYDPQQYWKDLQTHNQAAQHSWVKAFQERTGLIKGDSRMMELLSLTTEEVIARLNEAWREYSG
jgi:hypothetical protein